MKYLRVAVLCCLVSLTLAGVTLGQDIGVRDTCRYQPETATWTIASEADSIFSIELWGWTDDSNVVAATLGFKVVSSGDSDWGSFVDSLIVVHDFEFAWSGLTCDTALFRRTVLDTTLYPFDPYSTHYLGYNGLILGLLTTSIPWTPVYPVETSTKVGDLFLRIVDVTRMPAEFTITVDSAFYPPAGTFKHNVRGSDGFPPHFLKAEIDVVNLVSQPTQAVFDPDPAYIYYMFAYDPIMAYIYIGNFDDPYQADDVNSETILVNGSISPLSSEILTSYPGFTGDVVKLTIPIAYILEDYGAPIDTTAQLFEVTGEFSDSSPFMYEGTVNLIGKYSDNPRQWIVPDDMVLLHGDVNSDALIDIDDVVGIVTYIFGGGGAPKPLLIADCDCSDHVDIDDAVYLINFIFGGGSFPCHE